MVCNHSDDSVSLSAVIAAFAIKLEGLLLPCRAKVVLDHDQEFVVFGETIGVVEAEGLAFEQNAVVVDGNIIYIL